MGSDPGLLATGDAIDWSRCCSLGIWKRATERNSQGCVEVTLAARFYGLKRVGVCFGGTETPMPLNIKINVLP